LLTSDDFAFAEIAGLFHSEALFVRPKLAARGDEFAVDGGLKAAAIRAV
jgi:hypothetical protein